MENNKKVIILIRHGNTALNEKKTFRGHIDIPLDDTGIEQAEKTGKFLKDIGIEVIYSSPLSRAFTTAEIIQKHQDNKVEIIKETGFMDLDFGEWEGKTYEEVSINYEEIYQKWIRSPFEVKIPGGGTLYEVQDKSWGALNEIIKKNTSRIICIISHRIINKVLILKMLDIGANGIWKINQDPCCINIFEHNYGMYFVSKLNFNFHILNIKDSFFKID